MSNRTKIEDHLYKRGEVYYYRKFGFEAKLGKFLNDAKAKEAKRLFEANLTALGRAAFQYKAKDAWEEYIAERELQFKGLLPGHKKISRGTWNEMNDIWRRHLAKTFGNKKLADIDDVMWNQFVKRVDVKDPTNLRKVLGTFLRWCKSTGKMRVMPELNLAHRDRRKRKILTEDQIKALLTNADGSVLIFIALYLFMGVRWSEQLGLRWANVNLVEGWIYIAAETSRTRKDREIPLNRFVARLLTARLSEQQAAGIKTTFVFPKRGAPKEHMVMTGIQNAWDTVIRRSGLEGLDIRPHDLRATFEHFMHLNTAFTDTQREKMAGASIDIQRRIYLQGYQAKHLRGLEDVVSFDGLDELIEDHGQGMGKTKTDSNEE